MPSSSGFRPGFERSTTDDAINMARISANEQTDQKTMEAAVAPTNAKDNMDDIAKHDPPVEGLQRGVQDVESVTQTWTKATLIAVFLKYVSPPMQ